MKASIGTKLRYGKDVEMIKWEFKTTMIGNSLAVWWLGLGTFTARAWVPSLMGQLRWCTPPHPHRTPTKNNSLNILRTVMEVEFNFSLIEYGLDLLDHIY